MSECIYTARQAPNLRVSLRIDGAKRYIEFKECRFVTEDEAVIAELDRMLASPKYGSLRQLVRKVDKEAAEALVREHRRQKGRLNAAVKGATTTAPLDEARKLIPPREHVNKLPIDVNEMTQPEAEMLQQQLAGDDIRLMEETDLAKLRAETQVARAAQVPVSDVDVGEDIVKGDDSTLLAGIGAGDPHPELPRADDVKLASGLRLRSKSAASE